MEHRNKPLTLKQLREMDGQPAYWPEDKSWGIISVETTGRLLGILFFEVERTDQTLNMILNQGVWKFTPTSPRTLTLNHGNQSGKESVSIQSVKTADIIQQWKAIFARTTVKQWISMR